jgi:hypothetical protein
VKRSLSLKKNLPELKNSKVSVVLFAITFAAVGVLLVVLTRAATPTVSFQAESGSRSGNVTQVADATASGGSAIKFGTPVVAGACTTKPDANNTGPTGTLTTDNRTQISSSETIENKVFPAGLLIRADNVTLRNVKVVGGMDIGDELNNVMLDHVEARSVGITSSANVTIQYSHFTAFNGDALFVSGWNGVQTTDLTVKHSFIDRPSFTSTEAHWDGIQMRGVDGVNIFCNNFDVGPWQFEYNVLIYSEPDHGGNYNIFVDNNWLNGANFAFMGGTSIPTGYEITNNKIRSFDFYYGLCYPGGGLTASNIDQVIQTGNTLDGVPIDKVCKASDF